MEGFQGEDPRSALCGDLQLPVAVQEVRGLLAALFFLSLSIDCVCLCERASERVCLLSLCMDVFLLLVSRFSLYCVCFFSCLHVLERERARLRVSFVI